MTEFKHVESAKNKWLQYKNKNDIHTYTDQSFKLYK